MVEGFGMAGSFSVFFVMTLSCLIYDIRYVKETKGLSKDEIEEVFAGIYQKGYEK
jgi:hypothetical protein